MLFDYKLLATSARWGLLVGDILFVLVGQSGKMALDQLLDPLLLPQQRPLLKARKLAYAIFYVWIGVVNQTLVPLVVTSAGSSWWRQHIHVFLAAQLFLFQFFVRRCYRFPYSYVAGFKPSPWKDPTPEQIEAVLTASGVYVTLPTEHWADILSGVTTAERVAATLPPQMTPAQIMKLTRTRGPSFFRALEGDALPAVPGPEVGTERAEAAKKPPVQLKARIVEPAAC